MRVFLAVSTLTVKPQDHIEVLRDTCREHGLTGVHLAGMSMPSSGAPADPPYGDILRAMIRSTQAVIINLEDAIADCDVAFAGGLAASAGRVVIGYNLPAKATRGGLLVKSLRGLHGVSPPGTFAEAATLVATLFKRRMQAKAQRDDSSDIRAGGWMVLNHHEYLTEGTVVCVWHFHRDSMVVTGMGPTDGDALDEVRSQIGAPIPWNFLAPE